MIPTVDLKWCEFRKERKELLLASEYFGMPSQFYVYSHHTGRKVLFTHITPEHPLFDQDGWDGEQAVYEPSEPLPNVETLTIYNQY